MFAKVAPESPISHHTKALRDGKSHVGSFASSSENLTARLSDVGLTAKESHRFQLLAKVPEAELVELIAGIPKGMSGVTYPRPRKRGSLPYPPTRRGRLDGNVGRRFRGHVPSPPAPQPRSA